MVLTWIISLWSGDWIRICGVRKLLIHMQCKANACVLWRIFFYLFIYFRIKNSLGKIFIDPLLYDWQEPPWQVLSQGMIYSTSYSRFTSQMASKNCKKVCTVNCFTSCLALTCSDTIFWLDFETNERWWTRHVKTIYYRIK